MGTQTLNFYGFVDTNGNLKEGEVYLEDRKTLLYKGTFKTDSNKLSEGKLYNSDGSEAKIVNNNIYHVINDSRDADGNGEGELYIGLVLAFAGEFKDGDPKNGIVYKLDSGDSSRVLYGNLLYFLDSETAILKDGKLNGIFTDYFSGSELKAAGFFLTTSWLPKFKGEIRAGEYWNGILYEATLGEPGLFGYRSGIAKLKGYYKDGVYSVDKPVNFDVKV